MKPCVGRVVFLIFLTSLQLLVVPSSTKTAKAEHSEVESWNSAIRYARSGLGEPYTWGGRWWKDNDSWINEKKKDPASDSAKDSNGNSSQYIEGPDCSMYVTKVWAIPSYSAINQDIGHPFVVVNFYNTTDGHYWRHLGWNSLTTLDAWAWVHNGKHMGLYIKRTSNGDIVSWEARCYDGRNCPAWPLNGTLEVTRKANFIKQTQAARTLERKGWAYNGCNRCV